MEAPTRVHLSYFGQTESFARALPEKGLSGRVVRQVTLQDWGDDWALVALDRPFEYLGHRHDQVLIRTRWGDREVGGTEQTSVFMLLVPDPTVLDKPAVSSKDFEHAAWGMAGTLSGPLTIDADRDAYVVVRRGRQKTEFDRYADQSASGDRSTSLGGRDVHTVSYASTRGEIWRWYWRGWARPAGLWRHHVLVGIMFPVWPQLWFKSKRRTLTIDTHGWTSQTGTLLRISAWNEVRAIADTGDTIAILGKNGNALIVPSRAFPDEATQLEFLHDARRWHGKSLKILRCRRAVALRPAGYVPVIEIDGLQFSTLEEFYVHFGERALSEWWGENLDAFNDVLRGGFGTPEGGFILRWKNHKASIERLGHQEEVRRLTRVLQTCHPSHIPRIQRELEAAKNGQGPTVFDVLVEIIRNHGTGGVEAEDGVQLELL